MTHVAQAAALAAALVSLAAGVLGAWHWWRVQPSPAFWVSCRLSQALLVVQALVAGVLAAARERGLHVLPYCSFVRHYIQQHPETVDLVAEDDRPHFGLATADR